MENVFVFRRYILNYLKVKDHGGCNLLSNVCAIITTMIREIKQIGKILMIVGFE